MKVLLTGPPGIGKTTICKKVAAKLIERNCSVDGFYTEEVRNSAKKRIGFDIVPITNSADRKPLARIGDVLSCAEYQKNKVGNYHVFTTNVDAVALPTMGADVEVLIVDEIGKMELFSTNFSTTAKQILLEKEKTWFVLGTIPLPEKVPPKHAAFFDQLRRESDIKIIHVNYNNRDKLPEEVTDTVLKSNNK